MKTKIEKVQDKISVTPQVVVNKELDKIKKVTFTSGKLDEVNKYKIVVKL
ncbi:MAG: hypothetical protein ACLGH8_11535 [Bacteroidia bacterium]